MERNKNFLLSHIGPDRDVAFSSRVRFARNVKDYPFADRIDLPSEKELHERIVSLYRDGNAEIIPFSKQNAEEMSYAENLIVSPEFASGKKMRTLIIDSEKCLSVMIGEEDHIRLQCIMGGFSLDEAYANASDEEERLSEALTFSFDEKLGYLTHCPTNLGTGMRASVMLFLPALVSEGRIGAISSHLNKIGLVLRGIYGENSDPLASMFQLSNRVTLGISEEEILRRVKATAEKLIGEERSAREKLQKEKPLPFRDRVRRSFGLMNYAELLDSKEFLSLFSDVRLGIASGVIGEVGYDEIDRLLFDAMPASLISRFGEEAEKSENRDRLRAETVKEALGGQS